VQLHDKVLHAHFRRALHLRGQGLGVQGMGCEDRSKAACAHKRALRASK